MQSAWPKSPRCEGCSSTTTTHPEPTTPSIRSWPAIGVPGCRWMQLMSRWWSDYRPLEALVCLAVAVRVVLAEDNYLVREGVRKLIESEDDLEVVDVCADYESLLAAAGAELPDVVVTDIRMPPTGTDEGIRAANLIREEHPDIGVVVLSQYSEPAYALSFLDGGSRGRAYLLKERDSDIRQLAGAIREVAA